MKTTKLAILMEKQYDQSSTFCPSEIFMLLTFKLITNIRLTCIQWHMIFTPLPKGEPSTSKYQPHIMQHLRKEISSAHTRSKRWLFYSTIFVERIPNINQFIVLTVHRLPLLSTSMVTHPLAIIYIGEGLKNL